MSPGWSFWLFLRVLSAGESQPLQWFQPRLQECGKEQEEEVMAGLEEPSAGCGVRHALVLLHGPLVTRARNKWLPSYKCCSKGGVEVGETLALLAGQMGDSFPCSWGNHKGFLWMNSLMSNSLM